MSLSMPRDQIIMFILYWKYQFQQSKQRFNLLCQVMRTMKNSTH